MRIRRERWGRSAARVVGGAAVVAAAAGCWGQPGFGPLHQGSNPVEAGLTGANVATLAPAWTAAVDAGPVRADPVVSGPGVVHVSDDIAAYGIDTGTGTRLWRTPVVPAGPPAGLVAGPVAAEGGTLVVPWGGAPDSGGTVRLDAATGAVLGRGGGIGSMFVTRRDPWTVTVSSGLVEGTLPAAGIEVDGPVDWFLIVGFGVDPVPAPTAATVTSSHFFVGLGGGFYGVDILAAWDLDQGCPAGGPEAQAVVCQPDVRTALDGLPTTPVVSDDEATAFVATDAGTVYAVDTVTGAVRWSAAAGAAVTERPALASGGLLVATDAGTLLTFAAGGCGAATCPPIRTVPLAGRPATAPAVAGGVVYVATGRRLSAYPAAGPAVRPLWADGLDAPVTTGPTVAFGTLYAGTADGRLVAFRAGGP
jgi:outer membrane protein assembly factor BamB